MFGKTRHGNTYYYVCAPKKNYIPPGHDAPGSYFVRETALVHGLNQFLNQHVFGAYRRHLLDAHLRDLDDTARRDRQQQQAALRRGIADVESRIKRTVRNLESSTTPTKTSSATSTNAAPSSAPNATA